MRFLGLVALVVSVLGWAPAAAQAVPDPAIEVQRADVAVGDVVEVQLRGWRDRVVVLTICGNDAARGSADCNVVESTTVGIGELGAPVVTSLVAARPPVPCPCVVRASSGRPGEVLTTPLRIAGVPVAPVERPSSSDLVALDLHVEPDDRSLAERLQASLGGASRFSVDVVIRNRSAAPLPAVAVTGEASRFGGEVAQTFDLEVPAGLAPGARWRRTVRVEVPGPVLGRVSWHATASGAGGSVQDVARSTPVPLALVLVAGALAGDVTAMRLRRRRRHRERRRGTGLAGASSLACGRSGAAGPVQAAGSAGMSRSL